MLDQSQKRFLRSKCSVAVRCATYVGSLLIAFLLCACNPDPFPGSPEDLARYGVVPGKASDIEVHGVHFHVPARFPISLYSDGRIRKGRADELRFSLDISKVVEGTGDVDAGDALFNITRKSDVMVHVLSGTSELSKEAVPDKSSAPGSEDYYGLRFSRSNLSWRSIEERTPKGNPIIIFCTPCRSTFDYGDAVGIEYYFSDSELPHWKLIYESVLKTVQQFTSVANVAWVKRSAAHMVCGDALGDPHSAWADETGPTLFHSSKMTSLARQTRTNKCSIQQRAES